MDPTKDAIAAIRDRLGVQLMPVPDALRPASVRKAMGLPHRIEDMTAEQRVALGAERRAFNTENEALAAILNEPTEPNPEPQPDPVRVPITTAGVLAHFSPASRRALYTNPNAAPLFAAIAAGDADTTAALVQLAADAGAVPQLEADAVASLCRATVPDPSWSPLVGWAMATLGRDVDADDIACARLSDADFAAEEQARADAVLDDAVAVGSGLPARSTLATTVTTATPAPSAPGAPAAKSTGRAG